MTCDDVRHLLSAFLDGEVTLETRQRLGDHLDGCARCARRKAELGDISELVRAMPQPVMPDGLEDAVREALHGPGRAGPGRLRRRLAVVLPPLLSAAAAAGITALVMNGPDWRPPAPATPAASGEVIADLLPAHIRSLLGERPMHIASGDSHAVRPWFAGRLDFSPAAPDLGDAGYPLLGGRLDYAGDRVIAALVYGRRQHVINVFVWPDDGARPLPGEAIPLRHGYNAAGWQADGLAYVAVSDLNPQELTAFGRAFDARLKGTR